MSTEDTPDDRANSVTYGSMAFTSFTKWWGFNEDGGNVYIIKNQHLDDAAVIEVKNLPEGYVYELRISNETHFSERPVFDATGYMSSHPGNNPYIISRYTGEIALNGGDEFLLPEKSDATPLRVKNVPSGYVIDACAAVRCGDKLALHLTNEAEGKSAYALLNTATAAIEGPLHPIPLSRPASLIQREADIIWEVGNAKAWELPLSAYDLRANKHVFNTVIDSPRIICILGNKVYHVDIHDLLNIKKP